MIENVPGPVRRAGAALTIANLVGGCVGQLHTPYDPANSPPASVVATPLDLSVFNYEPTAVEPKQSRRPNVRKYYDSIRLRFPDVQKHGSPPMKLSATYHRSTLPSARKTVIVLPIWGSYRYPSRKTTKTLLKRSKGGIHVMELHGAEPLFDWIKLQHAPTEAAFISMATQMTGRVTDTVISLRKLLDWMEQQPEIDPDRIGVVGFSMGAIVASIALGVDERFAAGVLMMGAANPGDVFATCNGYPGAVRKSVKKRFGWSQQRYQAFFEELFEYGDPVDYSHRYDPERLLIIDGAFDGCMSRQARRALWEATGRPERVSFISQHKWSFLAFTPMTLNVAGKRIHDFMESKLEPADEQLACLAAAACP